jgi:TP901 family phage tail tape measure protein
MSDNKPVIDLSLSPASVKSWEDFSRLMHESKVAVERLKAEMKAVEDLSKVLKFNQIRQLPGGVESYQRGRSNMAARQNDRVVQAGTTQGDRYARSKDRVAEAEAYLRVSQKEERLHKAQNLNSSRQYDLLRRITSEKELQEMKAVAEMRTGLMLVAGQKKQVEQAKRLTLAIERRIALLRVEQKLERDLSAQRGKDEKRAAVALRNQTAAEAKAAKAAEQLAEKARGAAHVDGGLAAVQKGQRARQNLTVAQTARAGTQEGSWTDYTLDVSNANNRAGKAVIADGQMKQARALDLPSLISQVPHLDDRDQLKNLRSQVSTRMGYEALQGDDKSVRQALYLNELIENRLKKLLEIQRVERRMAEARAREEKTQQRLLELNGGDPTKLQQYKTGTAAQADLRASRVRQAGTESSIQATGNINQLQAASQQIRGQLAGDKLIAAQNLNLSEQLHLVESITDQKRLQELRDQSILRFGDLKSKGLHAEADQALQLNESAKRRLETVKEEARVNKELNANNVRRQKQRSFMTEDGGLHMMKTQASLLSNYMVLGAGLGAIGGTARFVTELDEALHNLQATVVVTDGNMVNLRERIFSVAESTKFFATELAEAAVNMGQAGMSAPDIQESLGGIALLASATGTDLAQSVDLATSVLGVFNKTADQTDEIANTITEAVNTSKLSIDKLTLGLQYAGNTAAQSGVSFEELTAALGAASNAGIRSGSTLGTGMRQLLISFQKPSKAFRQEMEALGLTMGDISLQTHGFTGVMENLREAGFSASDAIRSFEVRAASFYTAVAGQIDPMQEMMRAFITSNAAMKANETQMKSLANSGRQLVSSLQTTAATGLQPFVELLAKAATTMAEMVQGFAPLISATVTFGASLLALTTMSKVIALMAGFTGAQAALGAAAAGAAVQVSLLARAGSLLATVAKALTGPWGLLISVITAAGSLFYSMSKKGSDLAKDMDKMRTAFDNASGSVDKSAAEIKKTSDKISELQRRAADLKGEHLDLEVQKIHAEFAKLGIVLPENVSNVDTLIEALKNLKEQLGEEYILNISTSQQALDAMIQTQKALVSQSQSDLVSTALSVGTRVKTAKEVSPQKDPERQAQRDAVASLSDRAMAYGQQVTPSTSDANQLLLEISKLLRSIKDDPRLQDELRKLQKGLQDSTSQQRELTRQQTAKEGLDREMVAAQVNSKHPEMQTNLTQLDLDSRQWTKDAQGSGTLRERMAAILSANDRTLTQTDALDAQAKNLGAEAESILPNSGQTLMAQVQAQTNAIRAETKERNDAAIGEILEDFENNISESQSQMASELEDMDAKIEATADPAARTQLMEQRRQLVNSWNAKITADLSAVVQGYEFLQDDKKATKASGALREHQRTARQQDHDGRLEPIRNDRQALIQSMDQQNNDHSNAQKIAQLKLDQTPRQNVDERIAIITSMMEANQEHTKEQVAALEAIIELAKQDQTPEGRDNLAQAQQNKENVITDASVTNTQLANDLKAEEVRRHEIMIEGLKAIREKALNIMQNATTAKEAQAQEQVAIDATNKILGEQLQINTITDAPPVESEDAQNEHDTKIIDIQTETKRRIKKINKGEGGGGGRKRKSPGETWIDSQKALTSGYTSLSSRGVVSATEAGNVVANSKAAAQPRLESVDKELMGYYSQQASGLTLSVKEQERMNDLLQEQSGLLEIINGSYGKIGANQILEGDVMGGVTTSINGWAEQSLDLSDALEGGVINTLDTATSSLSTFFTSALDGTTSMKDAFSSMALSVVKAIEQVIAQMVAMQVVKSALGFSNSTFGTSFELPTGIKALGGHITSATPGRTVGHTRRFSLGGEPNRDSVLTMTQPGEYVMRKSAVDAIGVDTLSQMNAQGNSTVSESQQQATTEEETKEDSQGSTINFYLVDERSQTGSLSSNDVLAIVNDDLARGGTTKKLIKSIQTGNL